MDECCSDNYHSDRIARASRNTHHIALLQFSVGAEIHSYNKAV